MLSILAIVLLAYLLVVCCLVHLLSLSDSHVAQKGGRSMEDDELSYLAGCTLLFVACLAWTILRSM